MSSADRTTYAPFILAAHALMMTDDDMVKRSAIFEEFDGNNDGNGYDWSAVAQVVLDERLPDLAAAIDFNSEGGTFVAHGPQEALKQLAEMLQLVFHDDAQLRDLCSRAEWD